MHSSGLADANIDHQGVAAAPTPQSSQSSRIDKIVYLATSLVAAFLCAQYLRAPDVERPHVHRHTFYDPGTLLTKTRSRYASFFHEQEEAVGKYKVSFALGESWEPDSREQTKPHIWMGARMTHRLDDDWPLDTIFELTLFHGTDPDRCRKQRFSFRDGREWGKDARDPSGREYYSVNRADSDDGTIFIRFTNKETLDDLYSLGFIEDHKLSVGLSVIEKS